MSRGRIIPRDAGGVLTAIIGRSGCYPFGGKLRVNTGQKIGNTGSFLRWEALLLNRRSQVQILPGAPLPLEII